VTQHIDTPRSKTDFQHLLWQVSHDNVKVYKDEDGWTLLINGKCQHLQINGDCGIYATRPQICRDHSNDYCEYDAPSEDGFELYFQNYEELLRYCRKSFKRWE
jgi:Fe-S-cluster containining protein